MKIYRTAASVVVEQDERFFALPGTGWDELINRTDLIAFLQAQIKLVEPRKSIEPILPPAVSQEVWAAGVTYLRSRNARMDESSESGGANFYDRVYDADRPELFFKCAGHRVVGPGASVRLRADSSWQVPEPELAVVINSARQIVGYTIGNDMSCRDIEGANPLYLPQAKIYDGACAIGPCIYLCSETLPVETAIQMRIMRKNQPVFAGSTSLSQMKRTIPELRDWLTRELSFPQGCILLTGTGIVPPDGFTLHPGDQIDIQINIIGNLTNTVGA